MPEVAVYYMAGRFSIEQLELIKAEVKKEGPALFSVAERKLSSSSFSFAFCELSSPSELTQDVIVRITLHHYPERKKAADSAAEKLASKLGRALSPDYRSVVTTVGVSVVLAELGWGTCL